MGFYSKTRAPAPEKSAPTAKNRVWDFFASVPEMRRENHPQTLQPRRENRPTPIKLASGRTYWPSRDPIEEEGGLNVYAFVGNDSVGKFDILGLREICETRDDAGNFRLDEVIVDVDDVDDLISPAKDLLSKLAKKYGRKPEFPSLDHVWGYTVQIEFSCCECNARDTAVRWIPHTESDSTSLDASKMFSSDQEASTAASLVRNNLLDEAEWQCKSSKTK